MKKNTRTLICDCFDLGVEKPYNGEKVFQGVEIGRNMIELENGVVIEVEGDGQYHTSGDDNQRWATVETLEFDDDGELVQGVDFLGYTEV